MLHHHREHGDRAASRPHARLNHVAAQTRSQHVSGQSNRPDETNARDHRGQIGAVACGERLQLAARCRQIRDELAAKIGRLTARKPGHLATHIYIMTTVLCTALTGQRRARVTEGRGPRSAQRRHEPLLRVSEEKNKRIRNGVFRNV